MKKYSDLVGGGTFKRCFFSHPPLPIGEFCIHGGSCSTPVVKDADIYVGFDHLLWSCDKSYPWTPGHSFLFPIRDGYAPENTEQAKNLVEWLAMNLSAYQKIHLGCIGGHGRTGTILAALVYAVLGEKNAIEYVREHYCKKAVESQVQVDWLHAVYGITKATPSRRYNPQSFGDDLLDTGITHKSGGRYSSQYKSHHNRIDPTRAVANSTVEVSPLIKPFGIWGSNAI